MTDEIYSLYTTQSEVVFQLKQLGLAMNKNQTLQILDKHSFILDVLMLQNHQLVSWAHPHSSPPPHSDISPQYSQEDTECLESKWMLSILLASAFMVSFSSFYFYLLISTSHYFFLPFQLFSAFLLVLEIIISIWLS